jgi:hypothetical protein
LLLGSVGIDSIGEVHCQHGSTIAQAGSRISCCAFICWSDCIEPPKHRGYSPLARYIPLVYGRGLNPTFELTFAFFLGAIFNAPDGQVGN